MTTQKIIESYDVIGLMSGTSLDGLDIAHCIFQSVDDIWSFDINETRHVSYVDDWKNRLRRGLHLTDRDLGQLDTEYGGWLGDQVNSFIQEHNLSLDLLASHGHTVKHRPKDGITVQIGNGQVLADRCHITTVSDFRSLDVSLGGQGAPLVPIGDRDLFGDFDFCLNLGGIANVSFDLNGERIAYDIGIANMALNYLANQVGKEYDDSGRMARTGKIDAALLEALNGLNYYQISYPKSTGYEWFRDEIIPLFNTSNISIEDKLYTACHHIADRIARDILQAASNQLSRGNPTACLAMARRYKFGRPFLNRSEQRKIKAHTSVINHPRLLITGGGAKNTFLIQLLSYQLSGIEIFIPDQKLIDYKEALIFAFLAVKRIRNEVNCLQSVTGARRDSCGGVVFYPS